VSIPNNRILAVFAQIREIEAKRYDLSQDIKELWQELKNDGETPETIAALKEILREEKEDKKKRAAIDAVKSIYRPQLELSFDSTPSLVVEDEDKTPPFVGVHAAAG